MRKVLPFALALAIFAILAYLFRDDLDELKKISIDSPLWLVAALSLAVTNIYLRGLFNAQILAPFDVVPTHAENFFLAVVTRLGNYITPTRGGAVARAVYLKKRYELSYTAFVSQLGATYVITMLVSSSLGAAACLVIGRQDGVFSWPVFLLFTGVGTVQLLIVLFSPKLRKTRSKLANRVVGVINSWHTIRRNRSLVWRISLIVLLQCLASATMFFCIYRSFGVRISFPHSVFIMAATFITIVIRLTPAGLGVYEIIVVFMANAIAIGAAETLTAAILVRFLNIVILATLGPISVSFLTRRLQRARDGERKERISLFGDTRDAGGSL
jgi:uncharacterized protein (TIRG00374 family)